MSKLYRLWRQRIDNGPNNKLMHFTSCYTFVERITNCVMQIGRSTNRSIDRHVWRAYTHSQSQFWIICSAIHLTIYRTTHALILFLFFFSGRYLPQKTNRRCADSRWKWWRNEFQFSFVNHSTSIIFHSRNMWNNFGHFLFSSSFCAFFYGIKIKFHYKSQSWCLLLLVNACPMSTGRQCRVERSEEAVNRDQGRSIQPYCVSYRQYADFDLHFVRIWIVF